MKIIPRIRTYAKTFYTPDGKISYIARYAKSNNDLVKETLFYENGKPSSITHYLNGKIIHDVFFSPSGKRMGNITPLEYDVFETLQSKKLKNS